MQSGLRPINSPFLASDIQIEDGRDLDVVRSPMEVGSLTLTVNKRLDPRSMGWHEWVYWDRNTH
jgi:hypothetical protein